MIQCIASTVMGNLYNGFNKHVCVRVFSKVEISSIRIKKLIRLLNDAESVTEGVLSTEELVVEEFNIIHTFILAGLDDFRKQLSRCLAQLLVKKLNES